MGDLKKTLSCDRCNTIFVDCFDTIVFRRIKPKEVFNRWAEKLSEMYNLPHKKIYQIFTKTNFNMCLKKMIISFTLQESFDNVIEKFYNKLLKKFPSLDSEFIQQAKKLYVETEFEYFAVNDEMVGFLREEKNMGKQIFLVSDFYCKSDVLSVWLSQLKIIDVFDKVFSSCDFDKEKATSKLYKHLLRDLNLHHSSVIMYGDNVWSDICIARMCRLRAKRIKIKRT